MRVLLIEDDQLLGDGLRVGLTQVGYTVDWVTDGHSAESALQNEEFDIIVMDIGLPGKSGIEILQATRRRGLETPVLILTALDSVQDRVAGLDAGADDYLSKPFDLDELCARLRALSRRQTGRPEPEMIHGTLALDPASRKVKLDGQPVSLSLREFVLLQYLLQNIGRVVTRDRLEQTLYGWDGDVESNSLEVFIHHIRKKLGSDLITTVRGVGYMIEQ